MRHGRKSPHQRFNGYKLHAAATNTEQPLITAIEVAPANEQDGPRAAALVDAQPKGRRPKRLLGDTAYGIGPVRAKLAERGVDVLAPVPDGPAREGRLQTHNFRVDLEAGTVTCPAGQVAPIRTEPSGKRRASFSNPVCDQCPLRSSCLPPKGRRQILLAPEEDLLIAARKALEDPPTAEHLRRTRPRIERLLGLLTHRYGARKSRYIGAAKARLQRSGPPRSSTSTRSRGCSPRTRHDGRPTTPKPSSAEPSRTDHRSDHALARATFSAVS